MGKDSPYQKYVFNFEKRKVIGNFEEMYQQEDIQNFDSWHSSNLNHLPKKIHLAILNQYNFTSVLEYGCGKGAFTHLLKKTNNYVIGLDISETAIKKAKSCYGDKVDFDVIKDNDFKPCIDNRKFDLTVVLEVLSYVENWVEVLKDISSFSRYIYISLYLPANPIGYIKSNEMLIEGVEKYFDIITKVILNENGENSIFIFCKNFKMEELKCQDLK